MTPEECSAILRRGFKPHQLEWKLMQVGKSARGIWARCVPYIDARAVIERLDEAFGPLGYKITTEPVQVGNSAGMKCRIEAQLDARVHDVKEGKISGSIYTIVREDVCELTDIEALKGAASGALKRAFVLLGGGAYLYDAPDFYAMIGAPDSSLPRHGQTKEKEKFRWEIPTEAFDWMASTSNAEASPATSAVSPSPSATSSPGSSTPVSSAASGALAAPLKKVTPSKATHTDAGIPKNCPVCGKKVWNNLAKKASGEFKETAQDWVCSDKECKVGKFRTGGWVEDKTDKAEKNDDLSGTPNFGEPQLEDQAPLDEGQAEDFANEPY